MVYIVFIVASFLQQMWGSSVHKIPEHSSIDHNEMNKRQYINRVSQSVTIMHLSSSKAWS